jgi:hypothetical protein
MISEELRTNLTPTYEKMLTVDAFRNNCWEAFWTSMRAQRAVMEMQMTGICIDRERVDLLTDAYMTAKNDLAQKVRDFAHWNDEKNTLNLESVFQVREFLFGEKFNGKKRDDPRIPIRLRPPNAKSLLLTPAITTDKRPMPWDRVLEQGLEDQKSPSTNKTALAILMQDNCAVPRFNKRLNKAVLYDLGKPVGWLRDYRFVSQVLKSVLRTPEKDDAGNNLTATAGDGEGDYYVYPGGLPRAICSDGRVRTRIWPTKETRRWSTVNPPTQNSFDAQTEILTSVGWVPFPKLTKAHKVAQYTPATARIEFTKPARISRRRHRGYMVHIIGVQADLMVTPEHWCCFRRRRPDKFFAIRADDMFLGPEQRHLHAGYYEGGKERLSIYQVSWLCAVQADGNYVAGTLAIKFAFNKRRKYERLVVVLRELAIAWTEPEGKPAKYTIYIPQATNEVLLRWTRSLMPDKQLDRWLLRYDRETLDHFAEEFIHWDGLYTRGTEFSSSDKKNSDWVQIMWALSGRRARMRKYRPKNPRARDHWCVDRPIGARDFTELRKHRIKRVVYDDYVFSVEVPSSWVVVRRNGRVSVSGGGSPLPEACPIAAYRGSHLGFLSASMWGLR